MSIANWEILLSADGMILRTDEHEEIKIPPYPEWNLAQNAIEDRIGSLSGESGLELRGFTRFVLQGSF